MKNALGADFGVGGFEFGDVLRDGFGGGGVGGEGAEEGAVGGEAGEVGGELGRIALGKEEAGFFGSDGFGHAAEVGGDDGDGGGEGGVDDEGSVFVPDGGDDEDVEVGEDFADLGVGEGAEEMDAGVICGEPM